MNLYESIAWKLHKQEKYKRLPDDAVVEIIELASKREATQGVTVQDILLAYFEHALNCRVVKRFELTNKQKQLIFAAVHFLNLFLDNNDCDDKNVLKLHDVLTRISTRHHKDMDTQLKYAYKQFAKIVDYKDQKCNYLVFCTTLATFFAKHSDIDAKLKTKILNLSHKIYEEEERITDDLERLLNSSNICMKFCNNIEEDTPLVINGKIDKLNSMVDEWFEAGEFPEDFIQIIMKETDLEENVVNLYLSKRDDFE